MPERIVSSITTASFFFVAAVDCEAVVKSSVWSEESENASKWGRDTFLMKAPPVEIEFHAGGNHQRCSTKSATRKGLCNAP